MTKITLPPERKVGHLKLLRQERNISLAEYAALTALEQLDIIRGAQGKEKYDLLINSQNAEKLVPMLHPQELYLTINLLGAADSSELLALANTDQITLLLDLDCWEGDVLSPVLSLGWLELLLSTGEDKACQLAREIEPEILALFLKKHLTITRGLEAYDDDDAENARRLQSLYDIEYKSEDAAKIIDRLLKILQEREQESYLLIMEMIRSENMSVLEEELFQARGNRLLDYGILPTHEAREIYSYLDTESFKAGGKEDFSLEAEDLANPAALLTQATPGNLLADILAGGITHETDCELLNLVNRKMSADKTDISSPQEMAGTVQDIYDTLNLALEYMAGTDAEAGSEILRTTYLMHLYQFGFNLIRQRQLQGERLAEGTVYPFFDFPELLFIESLLEQPALFYRAPFGSHPSQLQKLTTRKDLSLVDKRLKQIEALAEFFMTGLSFSLPAVTEEEEVEFTLSTLFMTAVANQILRDEFAPTPLPAGTLMALKKQTISEGKIDPSFADNVETLIREQAPECIFFAEFCLDLWEEFFTALTEADDVEKSECFLLLQ